MSRVLLAGQMARLGYSRTPQPGGTRTFSLPLGTRCAGAGLGGHQPGEEDGVRGNFSVEERWEPCGAG